MSAIEDVLKRLASADLLIDQHRCVRVRNKNAQCRACAEACPTGCIGHEDNELIVAAEKCIGCATCTSACPTDALRPKKPTDDELFVLCTKAGEANDSRVVLACRNILDAADGLFDADKVVRVTCLGRIDQSMLVSLAAAGASSISLVSGDCGQCEKRRGFAVCEEVVGSVRTLLDAWNVPCKVRLSIKLPSSVRLVDDPGYDQSRRAFLLSTRDDAREVAEAAAFVAMEDALCLKAEEPPRFVHVDEQGSLPCSISARRQVLLDALRALERRFGQPQDIMIDTRMWSQVLIDSDKCLSCRMCATFCPTGANSKFSDDGVIGIRHQVSKCVNCRLCQDICPAAALSFSEEVFARDISEEVVESFPMKGRGLESGRDSMLESMRGSFVRSGTLVNFA